MSIINQRHNELDYFEVEDAPWRIGIRLDEEEKRWYNEVKEIMNQLNIDTFPTVKQFSQLGKNTLYNRIANYMGVELFREVYNL